MKVDVCRRPLFANPVTYYHVFIITMQLNYANKSSFLVLHTWQVLAPNISIRAIILDLIFITSAALRNPTYIRASTHWACQSDLSVVMDLLKGKSIRSSSIAGYHRCDLQTGATSTSNALSSCTFFGHFLIRQNGGKAYPFQLVQVCTLLHAAMIWVTFSSVRLIKISWESAIKPSNRIDWIGCRNDFFLLITKPSLSNRDVVWLSCLS